MNTQETKQEIMEEWQRLKFEHMQHFGRMADSEMIFKTCVLPLLDKALLSQLEEIIKVVESMEQNEQIACDYGDHIDKNEILSHLEKLNIKK